MNHKRSQEYRMKNKAEGQTVWQEAADAVLSVFTDALTLPTIAISWAVERLSKQKSGGKK